MSVDKKSTPPPQSSSSRPQPTSDIDELHARLYADPRFNPPTPSVWKRAALIILAITLLWLGVTLRKPMKRPDVLHAQRYVYAADIAGRILMLRSFISRKGLGPDGCVSGPREEDRAERKMGKR